MIKKKKVYLSMLGSFLTITLIFGFLFYSQQQVNVLPAMQKLVDPDGPPNFQMLIYGDFGENALSKPMDVAVIGQFIYVTDTNNKRVQVFDLAGTPIFKFGEEGKGPGQFVFPYGIAGDSQGNVYVADLYKGSISIFDSKGKFVKEFIDSKDNLIEAPGGLRIVNEKVYVTDIQKSKVFVFDMEGKKLLEIGGVGLADGQFRAPNAITADNEGNIYVVDTGNQRVQVFDSKGKFLKKLNGSADGTGDSVFVNPRGIALDSRGFVYVVSNLTHYIYGFDQEGKQAFVFGGLGEGNTQFTLPNGLFIDENNQIYITDTTNQRIAIYN